MFVCNEYSEWPNIAIAFVEMLWDIRFGIEWSSLAGDRQMANEQKRPLQAYHACTNIKAEMLAMTTLLLICYLQYSRRFVVLA